MEMLRETEREGHEWKGGELGRAVGEDCGGGDKEIAQAVDTEVGVDDAGAWVGAHRGSAHGVARVVEIRDEEREIRCEE